MRAQRVLSASFDAESWTVIDGGLAPIGPMEDYLAHLSAIERSPNTVPAYAHSLAVPAPTPSAQRASDASLQRRLETLLDANRCLRDENQKLRNQLALQIGEGRASTASRGRARTVGLCS